MKLGARRPGTSTSFVDSHHDETLLQFSWLGTGITSLAYHLYDSNGHLVADSGGVAPFEPVSIRDVSGELLLDVPESCEEHIRYRLYNRSGKLLTVSDGATTQIFGFLRMEPKRIWEGSNSQVS